MKIDKIRLHKHITQFVKNNSIEYTNHEIQNNIVKYGVCVDNVLEYKRLLWVYPNQTTGISHWPQREKGNMEDIRVIEETEEYMLIFKPYNLVVQPGAGHKKDNLIEWLLENYPEQRRIISEAPEHSNAKMTGGLVHRIDKNTQGLLLIAKSIEDLEYFQNQFRERQTHKEYLAVVEGLLEHDLSVTSWQTRDIKNPTKQRLFWSQTDAIQYNPQAREAKSTIKPLIYCKELNRTVLKVVIHTGRMHQIRLHCEAIGHPLINDPVYNKKNKEGKKNLEKKHRNIQKVNSEMFKNIINKISGGKEYCLISNRIQLNTRSGTVIDKTLYNI